VEAEIGLALFFLEKEDKPHLTEFLDNWAISDASAGNHTVIPAFAGMTILNMTIYALIPHGQTPP